MKVSDPDRARTYRDYGQVTISQNTTKESNNYACKNKPVMITDILKIHVYTL